MRARQMFLKALSTLALVAALLAVPSPAEASWTGPGCWVCSYSWPVGTIDERCDMVDDQEEGDGINCNEWFDGWGWQCSVPWQPCYNEDAGAGGGGSSAGGGASKTCTVRQGHLCPAECESCEIVYF